MKVVLAVHMRYKVVEPKRKTPSLNMFFNYIDPFSKPRPVFVKSAFSSRNFVLHNTAHLRLLHRCKLCFKRIQIFVFSSPMFIPIQLYNHLWLSMIVNERCRGCLTMFETLPWANVPWVVAMVSLAELTRLAVTTTSPTSWRMLTLMFSGTPGRKLEGVTTTYELW